MAVVGETSAIYYRFCSQLLCRAVRIFSFKVSGHETCLLLENQTSIAVHGDSLCTNDSNGVKIHLQMLYPDGRNNC